MNFQGEIAQISLVNIVQALFLNGQEGVLSVQNSELWCKFRILRAGLRPLMAAPGDVTLLWQAVLKERLLDEKRLTRIFSEMGERTLFPGDRLVESAALSTKKVENHLFRQFEESVYEVLTAKNLRYEFAAGEPSLEHEFFDPEGLGAALVFSINGLLMETARREDEWRRIEEALPSEFEIYTAVKKGLPPDVPPDVDVSEALYRETAKLLTGDRSIDSIIAGSRLSRYHVHHTLFQLKSRGYIRRLTLAEKETLAEKLRRQAKNRELEDVYRSILDEDPQRTSVRVQLVSLLERKDERVELLSHQYFVLAEQLEKDDPEAAHAYLQKVLAIDPDDLGAHEQLFLLHAHRGNRSRALAALRSLLKSARKLGRYEEGANILMRALNFYPDEAPVYHDLANLLLAGKENELAIECLKSAAGLYRKSGDIQRQIKTYEVIARLDPAEGANLKKLLETSRLEQRRPIRLLRLSFICSAIGMFLAAGLYFAFIEVDSRRVYAETERAVQEHLEAKCFSRASATLQDFLGTYWFSTRKKPAMELYATVQLQERDHRARREAERRELVRLLSSNLLKAERLIQTGEHAEAYMLIEKALEEAAKYQLTGEFRRNYEDMQALLTRVRTYLYGARRLEAAIRKARQENDLAAAHALSLELLRTYTGSEESLNLRIGVLVESSPPGADLYLGTKCFGKTPVIVDLPPHRVVLGTLERTGYRRTTVSIRPREEYRVHVGLQKLPIWTFDSGGPIDGVPASASGLVVFGNRNGRVFCLNPDGKRKWREFVVPLDVSGGVGSWRGTIYAGCFDGHVYLLDGSTGTARCPPVRGTPRLAPIKRAPADPTAAGTVTFNCDDEALVGIDLAARSLRWVYSSRSRLLGAPQLDRGRVYCFTQSGTLLELDPSSRSPAGDLRRTFALEGVLTQPGTVVDRIAYVGFASGSVKAVELESGKALWSIVLESTATAAPTYSRKHQALLLPLASEELVCLDAGSGSERWRRDIRGETSRIEEPQLSPGLGGIGAPGVVDAEHYFAGTRGGFIMCWRITDGGLAWMYETAGAREAAPKGIAASGLVAGGYYYQGSDDGRLYCFALAE